ncbi:MAG: hypothetical protein D3923_01215 [Candidatus Electrothrix sp. AR3]|nr:hypothetical protein [Candidatus Electrothrix sp. AR3]
MARKFFMITAGLLLCLFATAGWAETFFVANNPSNAAGWGNGSNDNNGSNRANPFLTLSYAIYQMSSGDELIIADGIYSGPGNLIDSASVQEVPSGTANAYTIIRAEHDGQVVIDGQGTQRCIKINGNDIVDGRKDYLSDYPQQYIQIQGIICTNASEPGNIYITRANHIKLINVGSVDPSVGHAAGITISYSTDCLIEGGYAWGSGRYKFLTYHATRIILRNCVARFDRVDANTNPIGSFSIYSSGNVEVQNCIDIDGGPASYYLNYNNVAGSFTVPTTDDTEFKDEPINFTNVMALNTNMRFGMSCWNAYPANTYFNNAVGWNIYSIENSSAPGGTLTDFFHTQGNVSFNHCTFGNVTNETNDVDGGYFNGWKNGNSNSIKNSIIHNFQQGDLFYDWEDVSSCNITDLTPGRALIGAGVIDTNMNPNPPLSHNPLENGLTYLADIDGGSTLASAGENGTYIGARMIKMYGKPGSLWGEPGYNKLQNGTDGQQDYGLWPFPNQDIIREKMRAYSYGNLSGNRGFCANGENLTSYIWTMLGAELPAWLQPDPTPVLPAKRSIAPAIRILLGL